MTPELTAIMKKSLKSNRWESFVLPNKQDYTNDAMVSRWVTEKNKWLNVSNKRWLPLACVYVCCLTLRLLCFCRDNPRLVERTAKKMFAEVSQADLSHRVKQSQPDSPSDAPWSSSQGLTAHSSNTTPLRMALSCTMKSGTSHHPPTSELFFDQHEINHYQCTLIHSILAPQNVA